MNPSTTLQPVLFQKIDQLASHFPAVGFKLAFHEDIDMFVLRITPDTDFEHNEPLQDRLFRLCTDFENQFPGETLVFVPSSSALNHGELLHNWPAAVPHTTAGTWHRWFANVLNSPVQYPSLPHPKVLFEEFRQIRWEHKTVDTESETGNVGSEVYSGLTHYAMAA